MSDEDRTVLSRCWPGPVRGRAKVTRSVRYLTDRLRDEARFDDRPVVTRSDLLAEAADAIERMEKRIVALEAELADVKRERDILAEQVMP